MLCTPTYERSDMPMSSSQQIIRVWWDSCGARQQCLPDGLTAVTKDPGLPDGLTAVTKDAGLSDGLTAVTKDPGLP